MSIHFLVFPESGLAKEKVTFLFLSWTLQTVAFPQVLSAPDSWVCFFLSLEYIHVFVNNVTEEYEI